MAEKSFGRSASGPSDVLTRSDSTADGCCRLSVASTTSLNLKPYGGNTLWVGGQACTIPSGGVTLSSPTVSASTLYYVYATASGGTINALALSTTGHITGADGREYLNASGSANTAQRLVGMLYTNASSQFVDTTAWRGCLNWAKASRNVLQAEIAANNATSSTSAAAYGNSTTFLAWADDVVSFTLAGNVLPNTAGALAQAFVGVDGATVGAAGVFNAPSANAYGNVPTAASKLLTEGPHTLQNFGSVNTGSATFNTVLDAFIRG